MSPDEALAAIGLALHAEFWEDSVPHEDPCCRTSAERVSAALTTEGFSIVPSDELAGLRARLLNASVVLHDGAGHKPAYEVCEAGACAADRAALEGVSR